MLFSSGAHPRYPVFESKTGLQAPLTLSRCGGGALSQIVAGEAEDLAVKKTGNSGKLTSETAQKYIDTCIQEHEGVEIDIRRTSRGLQGEGK